ncbi:MAG TPA: hypothetical protein VMT86_18530 [Bryobacteraceae bacterium]|nr:hypothetical protein [Bryobacteraceae bacterium]
MDLAKALAELRQQRDNIDQAIMSLERLAADRPRGRGRPPGRKSGSGKKRQVHAVANEGNKSVPG